jgi:citrate lyase beta subunit
VSSACIELSRSGRVVVPRINSFDSGLETVELDLRAVVSASISGVSIGKINREEDLHNLHDMISYHERKQGLRMGHVAVLPWIETAEGVCNAYHICSAPRVYGVAFGADDFTASMGLPLGAVHDRSLFSYARAAIATAAHARGVFAYDTPYVNFTDEAGLQEECRCDPLQALLTSLHPPPQICSIHGLPWQVCNPPLPAVRH